MGGDWQTDNGSPWLSPSRGPAEPAVGDEWSFGPGAERGVVPGAAPSAVAPPPVSSLPPGLAPVPVTPTYSAPPPPPQSYSAEPSYAAQPPYTAQPPYGGQQSYAETPANYDPMATQMVAVGTVQPRVTEPGPGTVEDAERVLAAAVDVVRATPDMYALGTVADGAVCLIPEDGRWSVFLAEAGSRRFAGSFEDPELAAVHFAGVLLLLAQERGTLSRVADLDPAPDRSTDPLAAFLAGPPIEPLAGDPPVSLYAERRLTVLTPGTEVDRFGDQEGNTVYAARTRYAHRSLPPDFVDRDYRVYRVLGPLRAVTGQAVPWFGQPGGGTVYLLPRPIRDLIREGLLAEIPAATVAPI